MTIPCPLLKIAFFSLSFLYYFAYLDTGQAKGVAHEPTRLEHGRLEHGQNHEDRKNSKQKMDVEEEARDDMEGDEGESQITPSLDDSDEDKNGTAEDNTVWCPCGIYEVRVLYSPSLGHQSRGRHLLERPHFAWTVTSSERPPLLED